MKNVILAMAIFFATFVTAQSVVDDGRVFNQAEQDSLEAKIANPGISTSTEGCNEIRVVVHVIYDSMESTGTGTNITDNQVLSQIQVTNEFFTNSGYFYHVDNNPLGYTIKLAEYDEAGNPTTGIIHHDGVALFGTIWHTMGVKDDAATGVGHQTLANAVGWGTDINGKEYINSYIVPKIDGGSGGGVQAFAYFPTSNVVYGNYNLYNTFGAEQVEADYGETFTLKSYTDLGLTWTHELMHNFAIFHDFNSTTSCTSETVCTLQGDRVCDTFSHPQWSSCGETRANVMDYVGQSFKHLITEGQAERADLAIQNSLPEWLVCAECEPSPDGDFNEDGMYSILDWSFLNGGFGCEIGDACYDDWLDANCDGVINIIDISMWQFIYDNQWPSLVAEEPVWRQETKIEYYNFNGQRVLESTPGYKVKWVNGSPVETIYRN